MTITVEHQELVVMLLCLSILYLLLLIRYRMYKAQRNDEVEKYHLQARTAQAERTNLANRLSRANALLEYHNEDPA